MRAALRASPPPSRFPIMVATKSTPWLRRGAFAAGLVAAVTVVVISRFPAAERTPLGLDVSLTTGPTGELAVAPVGTVGSARGLIPGHGLLQQQVTLENQTDAQLSVAIRARPSISDSDTAMRVRLTGPKGVLYDGPAAGMREYTQRSLRIAPHGSAPFVVAAWLPAGASEGWRGRSVTLPLMYRTKILGRAR